MLTNKTSRSLRLLLSILCCLLLNAAYNPALALDKAALQLKWQEHNQLAVNFWPLVWMVLFFSAVIAVLARFIFNYRRLNKRLNQEISERKQSAEALRESESLLRNIFETSHAGIMLGTPEGRLVFANIRLAEMVGSTPEELVGAKYSDFVHPDDRQVSMAQFKSLLNGEVDVVETERHFLHKDGSDFWGYLSARKTKDSEGKIQHLVGIVTDITDIKQATKALQQSHAMLKGLSAQVPGILFQTIMSPDGHFSTPYASEKSYDIYELSPDQIQADISVVFDRIHPADLDRVMAEIMESVNELKLWECEYRVVLPRQGLKWVTGVAQPQKLEDGTVVMYGIIMDATAHKRAEQALKEQLELLDLAHDAIIVRSMDGNVLFWNHGAEVLYKYTREQALGSNLHDLLKTVFPGELDEINRDLQQNGHWDGHLTHTTRDGAHIVVMSRWVLQQDENGQPGHIMEINTDITDQESIQKERLKIQKLESLGVLAGGIAHDFNNILTGIIGNISLSRMLIDESHRAASILKEAEKASQRAADLAHQLLTFAKGSQPIKKVVSVRQIVEAAASLVLRGSNVLCRIDLPDTLYDIDVDEGQISQAFNNIIINAAQAMPSGGTIRITAENVTLNGSNTVPLAPGSYIKLTFEDTGCGIPEDVQKKIFDPYFTTKAGGSGLGLASVYSIINKHEGYISVHSRPGSGTIFEILLPASSEKALQADADVIAVTAEEQRDVTILVMDDEEMIREMASVMLDALGYNARTCANGEEAIALYTASRAAGTPFSAVIMDLTIPGGMGGKDAAQKIIKSYPDARLIVSSGYSNDPVMAEYARYGFCATITKPYNISEIANTLKAVLSAAALP